LSNKFEENMCNGIVLVEKIDLLIKELGLSRKAWSMQFGINPSTIATWRTRNILPPMETIEAIAEYFKVSIEWLVTEDSTSKLFDSHKIKASRKAIRDRIYDIADSKTPAKYENLEELHKLFFEDITEFTFSFLYNWSEGRVNINEYVFEEIAFKLGVTLDYLISGTEKEGEFINQQETSEVDDAYILRKARPNLNELFCLARLSGSRKQLASDMLEQLATLERLEYNKRHNINT
jgi:transcriptional regulator with XRE-family HTH domain